MPGAVYLRPVGMPSTDSGKGTAALVAQKTTLNIDGGRTLRQINATLIKDAVKRAAPDKAQAPVNMGSSGPALDTVKSTCPHIRRATDKSDPGRQGSNTCAQ